MAKTLSAKDTHILSLLSLPLPVHPPSPTPNPYPSSASPLPTYLATHEASILAPLNQPSPPPSALHTAITALNTLIASHPSHASAYNNRAQANRILHGDHLRSEAVQKARIWEDLTKAIALAEAEADDPEAGREEEEEEIVVEVEVGERERARSEEEQQRRRKVLSAAYTQRAWMVYKLASSGCDRIASSSSGLSDPAWTSSNRGGSRKEKDGKTEIGGGACTGLPAELRGRDPALLEEWASRDFEKGGRYGNGVAREMARATNPYAKLCGAMVGEVMRREMGGEGS